MDDRSPAAETEFPLPSAAVLASRVAADLELPTAGVTAAVALFDEGCTVPFVARYRKEATGGLDDEALVGVNERLTFHREMEDRRRTVLQTIHDQGKLTPDLRRAVEAAATRSALEDLYLPYKPKRRTRASMAKERGLEPLADRMWDQLDASGSVDAIAAEFVDPEREVADVDAALKGARDIIAERMAETADLRAATRDLMRESGVLSSKAARGKADQRSKFEDYYDFSEPVGRIASHRVLAIRRGEKEGWLGFRIEAPRERALGILNRGVLASRPSIWEEQVRLAIEDGWDRLLSLQIETEIRLELKQWADQAAIDVFASNLRDLLLAPPFGSCTVLAVDPGLRTGCKVVVLDDTGRLLDHGLVWPTKPREDVAGTEKALDEWHREFGFGAAAVGNGTGGRETFAVVRGWAKKRGLDLPVLLVNESGASVYSASEVAREELPDHDVTVRGAVSIGRRMQDPLAELVKIDPKSIGVGQYQHDVEQKQLKERLDDVVVGCVNSVGVDVNTASASLLAYVSGMGASLARSVVAHRDATGPFVARAGLLDVPRLGAKTYQQAAGFLRVCGGHPLDDSAVHPERYELVEKIAADLQRDVRDLIGDEAALRSIDSQRYFCDDVGRYTLDDILTELARPGRDPRGDVEVVAFRDDVNDVSDLEEGMELAGVVTNVTHFGAFVDIGVHQDGLVHVSQIAHRFVRDPAEELSVGQEVKVRVMEVDAERQRISLSMKALLPRP
jgi:uncharacterized protein